MAKSKQIEFLPAGWEWRYKGEQQWTTAKGTASYERHAYNVNTGKTLSVRQAQNLQREERVRQGQPKAPTVQRTGRTKRIVNKGQPGENTKRGDVGSLYNPARHGKTETWVFRSLSDAQNYVTKNALPKWAKFGIIQVRFTERLVVTSKTGSDTRSKNGYASITPFRSTRDLVEFTDPTLHARGEIDSPWTVAENNISNYDMTGDRARVYIYLQER